MNPSYLNIIPLLPNATWSNYVYSKTDSHTQRFCTTCWWISYADREEYTVTWSSHDPVLLGTQTFTVSMCRSCFMLMHNRIELEHKRLPLLPLSSILGRIARTEYLKSFLYNDCWTNDCCRAGGRCWWCFEYRNTHTDCEQEAFYQLTLAGVKRSNLLFARSLPLPREICDLVYHIAPQITSALEAALFILRDD